MKKIMFSVSVIFFSISNQTYNASCVKLQENLASDVLMNGEKVCVKNSRQLVQPVGKEIMALSIDGGGIRGIIPAVIITTIEGMIKEKIDDGSDHYIADYVDCIAGISVGGIIASLVSISDEKGTSCYSGNDVYQILRKDCKNIFSKNYFSFLGLCKPLYGNKHLKQLAQSKLLKSKSAEKYPTLADITKVNFISLAVDIANEKTILYKNWKARENADYNYYLHDVAVSTSSAPYYFPAYYMENVNGTSKHKTSDGGVCLNNPSQIMYNSMHKFFPDGKINIISLGTGEIDAKDVVDYSKGEGGILSEIYNLISSFMWSDSYIIDYALRNEMLNVDYKRFQTPLVLASSSMDDVQDNNIISLREDVLGYIEKEFSAFEDISEKLIKNKFSNIATLKNIEKESFMATLRVHLNNN